MDHVFGLKILINKLSCLGFSIRYDKVVRYKQSVIQSETLENLLSQYIPDTFTQWVAENVDHYVVSVDGQGMFHGKGSFFYERCCTVTYEAMHNSEASTNHSE